MTLLPATYKSWEILFCHHFDWTISYTHFLVGFIYTFSSLFSSLFIQFIECLHIMRDLGLGKNLRYAKSGFFYVKHTLKEFWNDSGIDEMGMQLEQTV